jgi:hypothetical protein
MLAPNYLDANTLGITDSQRISLICTLKDFEQDRVGPFNMGSWGWCMAAHCDKHYGTDFVSRGRYASFSGSPTPLDQLFGSRMIERMEDITVGQAARALRNYLTTGDPQW